MEKISLHQVNAALKKDFVQYFGQVFEHSSWIAQATFDKRPFASLASLHQTMCQILDEAGQSKHLEVFCLHPELSGQQAQAGQLTAFSSKEQARIGLDRLTKEQFDFMHAFNQEYRAKFGFPFIVCVGYLRSLSDLFEIQKKRLQNNAETEQKNALAEVNKIAWLRLVSLCYEE